MKDRSLLKLGAVASILLGVAKLFSGGIYFFVAPEQRVASPGALLLPSFAQDPLRLTLLFWAEALVGIFGFAVVPALASLLRERSEGWVRWSSTLATVGYAIASAGYLLTIARLPVIAAAYVKGEPSTQAALAAVWKSSPDLQGFWGYAAIGVWVLVMSLLAMRGQGFPRGYALLGLLLAILYLLIPVAVIPKNQTLVLGIVGLGAIVAPIWYVWTGLVLRRRASSD